MQPDQSSCDSAEVVIIGGGIIGCSIAYHLAAAGLSDVLVLERNELSSGATARSAGLLTHGRADGNTIKMIARTRADIAALETQLDEQLDLKQVGAIRAVHSAAREQDLRAMEDCLLSEGETVEELTASDARRLSPWLDLESAVRIIFLPNDGYIDGARLGYAYSKAARQMGCRIRRSVAVRGVLRDGEKVTGVLTDQGNITSKLVVDAAGAWSVQIAKWAGWNFPASPTRSHYWITAPDGNGSAQQPNVQLPDFRAYFRAEVGGLVVGIQEPQTRTYDPFTLPPDMDDILLHDEEYDLDLLVEQASELKAVIPDIENWQFAHHITGLTSYTPDGKFVIGEIEGLAGFLVAGGCCGSGVAAAGGFGQTIADMVLGKAPQIDLDIYSPNRFGPVDPASQEFRDICAAARAGKSRGRPDQVQARQRGATTA